jgi:hypothetical protein
MRQPRRTVESPVLEPRALAGGHDVAVEPLGVRRIGGGVEGLGHLALQVDPAAELLERAPVDLAHVLAPLVPVVPVPELLGLRVVQQDVEVEAPAHAVDGRLGHGAAARLWRVAQLGQQAVVLAHVALEDAEHGLAAVAGSPPLGLFADGAGQRLALTGAGAARDRLDDRRTAQVDPRLAQVEVRERVEEVSALSDHLREQAVDVIGLFLGHTGDLDQRGGVPAADRAPVGVEAVRHDVGSDQRQGHEGPSRGLAGALRADPGRAAVEQAQPVRLLHAEEADEELHLVVVEHDVLALAVAAGDTEVLFDPLHDAPAQRRDLAGIVGLERHLSSRCACSPGAPRCVGWRGAPTPRRSPRPAPGSSRSCRARPGRRGSRRAWPRTGESRPAAR